MTQRRRAANGFTIVELLIVVAVIAIAAAIFWTAGIPTRYFALGGAMFAAFFALAVAIDPYRIKRDVFLQNV